MAIFNSFLYVYQRVYLPYSQAFCQLREQLGPALPLGKKKNIPQRKIMGKCSMVFPSWLLEVLEFLFVYMIIHDDMMTNYKILIC